MTTTAGSWPWSRSWKLADRLPPVPPSPGQLPDRVGRQRGLGEEPDRRAGRDQVREVLLRMGGDQDDRGGDSPPPRPQAPGDVEAALRSELDVHQGDVRPQSLGLLERLLGRRGLADDADA